ncbi:MAG: hypothetical protein AAF682_14355 [Planctomycetota bacterium]
MNLRRPSLRAAACGLLLAIASFAVAQGTGLVKIGDGVLNAAFNVEVPEGAQSYQITVYDHDGWWNWDDVLASEPIKNLVEDGKKPKSLSIQTSFECIGGHVAGAKGSSGEPTAEVYCVIQWYSKTKEELAHSGEDDPEPVSKTETEVHSVACK